MEIADGMVVSIEYVLKNPKGEELDRSKPDSPMVYLHGHKNIVPGLERQLVGKKKGDELEAVVPAAEGYGPKQKIKSLRIPRSQLPDDIEVTKGAQLVMQQDGKHYPVWVEKVQGPTVILSPQHPLAGVDLHFQVTVVEVREATEEEKQHSHVHGPGGHEH